jgi:hypothetical protein
MRARAARRRRRGRLADAVPQTGPVTQAEAEARVRLLWQRLARALSSEVSATSASSCALHPSGEKGNARCKRRTRATAR